jgi:hypothetical protein
MQIIDALRSACSTPHWGRTVIALGTAMLIPVVGTAIALGYAGRRTRRMMRGVPTEQLDFDLHDLRGYLREGWALLVVFLAGALVAVPLAAAFLVTTMTLIRTSDGRSLVTVATVIFSILWFVFVMTLIGVVLTPMFIRAARTLSVRSALAPRPALFFVHRCLGPAAAGQVMLMAAKMLALILGTLAFGVGIVPALAIVLLAHGWSWAHMYGVYQERGGEPWPIVTRSPTVEPPGDERSDAVH